MPLAILDNKGDTAMPKTGNIKKAIKKTLKERRPPDNFIEKLSTPPWHVKAKVYE